LPSDARRLTAAAEPIDAHPDGILSTTPSFGLSGSSKLGFFVSLD
jgi:hypothetical protein